MSLDKDERRTRIASAARVKRAQERLARLMVEADEFRSRGMPRLADIREADARAEVRFIASERIRMRWAS